MKFFFTFDPMSSLCDNYVVIDAATEDAARVVMSGFYGINWDQCFDDINELDDLDEVSFGTEQELDPGEEEEED